MPAKGYTYTKYIKRGSRAERIDKKLRAMIEDCVFINYAIDRRDLTGRICGDPMPGHYESRERLEQWKGETETNTKENSEDI